MLLAAIAEVAVKTVTLPKLGLGYVVLVVHVFVGFVQIVVDRFSTYRGWYVYPSLLLHMEIKLFYYDLSSCTCFDVGLHL